MSRARIDPKRSELAESVLTGNFRHLLWTKEERVLVMRYRDRMSWKAIAKRLKVPLREPQRIERAAIFDLSDEPGPAFSKVIGRRYRLYEQTILEQFVSQPPLYVQIMGRKK